MYVLKKETKRRNYFQGTGGGSPIKICFLFLEEELLDFLTPEAAGLENIPHTQGGINLQDNSNNTQEIYFDNSQSVERQNLQFNKTENVSLRTKLHKDSSVLNLNGIICDTLRIRLNCFNC